MGHFTSLRESSNQEAKEIHSIISTHPAFSYIRTSYLYDSLYANFKATTDNLSEARIRTVLHMLHILDEIAYSLGLLDNTNRYSLPEHLFIDAFSNPRYKAYSPMVTHESRLRQQQRLRKQQQQPQQSIASKVSDSIPVVNNDLNAFTSLIRKSKNE